MQKPGIFFYKVFFISFMKIYMKIKKYLMGCDLLIYFCFLIVAVLLNSKSMFLVLYVIVFEYSIFNLTIDQELYV